MATNEEIVAAAQQLYVSYYGRPADPEGLAFWIEYFTNTDDVDQALVDFGTSDEYLEILEDAGDTEALINQLYQFMFNRDADEEGLAFYTDLLDSGESSLAAIALDIANGAQNDDVTILNNKIGVANSFTADVEANSSIYAASDIPGAQAVLDVVDLSDESVAAGEAASAAFVEALPQEITGGEYTLDEDNPTADFVGATGAVTVTLDGDSDEADFVVNLSNFDDTVILEELKSAALTDPGGIDTLDTQEHSGSANVNLLTGSFAMIDGAESFGGTISGIENVIGTDENDTITGDNGDNSIWGLDGADTLKGGLGDDTFYFEDQDQIADDGTILATVDGQTGDDTVVFSADAVDLSAVVAAHLAVENLVLSNGDGEDEVELTLAADGGTEVSLEDFDSITGSDADDMITVDGTAIDISGATLTSIDTIVGTTAASTFTIATTDGAPALVQDAGTDTDATLVLASKSSTTFDVAGLSLTDFNQVVGNDNSGGTDTEVFDTVWLSSALIAELAGNNGDDFDGIFDQLDDVQVSGTDVAVLTTNVDFTAMGAANEDDLGLATVEMGSGVTTVVVDNLETVGFNKLVGGLGTEDTLVVNGQDMDLTAKTVSAVENIVIDVASADAGMFDVTIDEGSLVDIATINGEVNFIADVTDAGEAKGSVVDLEGVTVTDGEDLSSSTDISTSAGTNWDATANRISISQEGLDGFASLGAESGLISLAVDGEFDLSNANIDAPTTPGAGQTATAGTGVQLDVLGSDNDDTVTGEDPATFLASAASLGRYFNSLDGTNGFQASADYDLGDGNDSFSGAATSLNVGAGSNTVSGALVTGDLTLTDGAASASKSDDGNNLVTGVVGGTTTGGYGDDTLIGLFGAESSTLAAAKATILGAGNDSIKGIVNGDYSTNTGTSAEAGDLGSGDDSFTGFTPVLGGALANARGKEANSVVNGGSGDDTLTAFTKGDNLTGGSGNDVFTISGMATGPQFVGEETTNTGVVGRFGTALGNTTTNLLGVTPTTTIGDGTAENATKNTGGTAYTINDFNDGVPDTLQIDLVGTYTTGTTFTEGRQGLTGTITITTALADARTENGGVKIINQQGDLITIAEGEAIGSTVTLEGFFNAAAVTAWLKNTSIAGTSDGGVAPEYANTTFVLFAMGRTAAGTAAATDGVLKAFLITADSASSGTVATGEVSTIGLVNFNGGNIPTGGEIVLI